MTSSELIEYLSAQGFNVFPDANHMPDVDESQLPALFLFNSGGSGSDPDLPIRYPAYQVIVKGQSYTIDPLNMSRAEEVCKALITLLDQKKNYVVGDSTVYYSRAVQSDPIPIGLDLKDRPIFSSNFNFKLQAARKGVL